MSLILSEYIEPFSACLIKSVCKIFDVKVTNTHCCSLAKNDPLNVFSKSVIKTSNFLSLHHHAVILLPAHHASLAQRCKVFISASPRMQYFCRLVIKNSVLDSY